MSSWFYLTLWRGTPPEFTEELETEINDAENIDSAIAKESHVGSLIDTVVNYSLKIRSRDTFGTAINTETEIIWYVG